MGKSQPAKKGEVKEDDKNQPAKEGEVKEDDKNQPAKKGIVKEDDKNQPAKKGEVKEDDKNQLEEMINNNGSYKKIKKNHLKDDRNQSLNNLSEDYRDGDEMIHNGLKQRWYAIKYGPQRIENIQEIENDNNKIENISK